MQQYLAVDRRGVNRAWQCRQDCCGAGVACLARYRRFCSFFSSRSRSAWQGLQRERRRRREWVRPRRLASESAGLTTAMVATKLAPQSGQREQLTS
jgi:aminoglycoside phosphotransferase